MTAYAAAQLVLAVPALVLFVLVVVFGALSVIVVGVPVVLLALPALRWVADRHRVMARRVLGTPFVTPYRPRRPGGLVARLVGLGVGPDDLARPRLGARAPATVGFALSLPGRAAAPARGHRRPVVVRDRADHACARRDGPVVPLLRPHRGTRATGPGADRDASRDPGPLGCRAPTARTRPARRRAGTPRGPLDEPRPGRLALRVRPGGSAPARERGPCHDLRRARRPALGRARDPSARCSPTGASAELSASLALDMAIPVQVIRRLPRPAARAGRVGRLLRRSPSAWPTSASTPAQDRPGSR